MKCRKFFLLFLILPLTPGLAQELEMRENKEFKGLGSYVNQAAFSPFGEYFAYTTGENIIRVFDRNWEKIFEHQGDTESGGGSFAFSPDGEYLAFGRYKGNTDIAILRLSDQKVVQVLDRHRSYVYEMKFSNDGLFLSSCGYDSEMILWQRTGENFTYYRQYEGFESYLYESSFSHDDKFIVTGDSYGNIKVYEREGEDYKLFQEMKFRRHGVSSVLFRPGTYEFVTGSSYGLRRYILNKDQFILQDSVQGNAYIRQPMSFSPQGKYLAITHYSQVKIYKMHADSMQMVDVTRRHSEETTGTSFSEDGSFLTTFGIDEKILIWEVQKISPSDKAMVSGWILGHKSLAQRRSLTPSVCSRILKEVPTSLSAPRDEFEKTIDYDARMDVLSDRALSILQEEMEKIYSVKSKGNTVSFPVTSILGYNADLEIYKIRMMDTEAGVRIPVEEARKFKKSWSKAIISANKDKKKNHKSAAYSNFVLSFSGSNETFEVTPLENPFEPSSKIEGGSSESPARSPKRAVSATRSENDTLGTTYALLFATNVYEYFDDLVNPVIDAQTIAAELKESYGVYPEVVLNSNLTEIAAKIREYASMEYGKYDNLMVFFAGHGVYDEVFREGYVISRDSRADDIGKTSYLSHSNLRTMINNIKCPHIFLVMDVCFGGTFDPRLSSTHRGTGAYASVSIDEYIKRKLRYKTRLYLTSGGKDYVSDGSPGFHSPFAYYFLEALRDYGGEDGVLTTAEILQVVDVVDPTPQFGEFGDNQPGSDFILIVKTEG